MYHWYTEPITGFKSVSKSAHRAMLNVISMHWFYGLNITFSAFKPITNLNGFFMSYCDTHHKDCVTKSLMTTKISFYWANANKNGLLQRFLKRKSLELLHFVSISRLRKRAEASISKQNKSWWSSFQHCSLQKKLIPWTVLSILDWKWCDSKTGLAGLAIPVKKTECKRLV